MHPNTHAHHVHVPVVHVFHAPHLEWREVAHPIRAAMITAGVAASAGVANIAFDSARATWTRLTAPAPATLQLEVKPLSPEWRVHYPKVDTRSMYRRGAEVRTTDRMWRRR